MQDLPDAESAPLPHIAEVKLFANMVAVALVVSAHYPDLGVNHELLEPSASVATASWPQRCQPRRSK